VQAMVDGPAAQALGELARARWQRAATQAPVASRAADVDPWPAACVPDLTDIEVAIARTEPAFEGQPGVHEVRQLHLDAIAAAKRHLFFENQYFTSGLIADALSVRLAEADGPEVVVISPETQSGWLEKVTMGVLRARMQRRLQEVDRYGRYRLYCPSIPGLKDGCLNVHSKVFAADDELFSVGSANLSNRSMALDTECNLVIEARGNCAKKARIREGIARLRNRLLAEHLDTPVAAVDRELAHRDSLIGAVEALRHPGRSLQSCNPVVAPELDALIPEQALFDPERPIDPDELVAQLVPADAREPAPRRLIVLGALAIALAALAIAWRWTPVREWVNLASLVTIARSLENLPLTPLAIAFGYVVAGLAMVPVMLLIAVTGIVFGPVLGAAYAIAGTMLSAAVTYGLGRWLGRATVHRLLGPRINRLSESVARRGILAMMVIRVLPVAPFTIVNVVAGASHIGFRDFMLGTLLGMSPGIVVTVTFIHNLAEVVRNPSVGTVTVLALVAAFLIGFALLLQRLLGRKSDQEAR
jgi:phospholipase D1/2